MRGTRFIVALALLAGLNLALGGTTLYYYLGPPRYFQTELLSHRVIEQGDDFAVLEVEYYYTGELGAEVWMHAVTTAEGKTSSKWMWYPVQMAAGRRSAQIRIASNPKVPEPACSTEVLVEFSGPLRFPFYRTFIPFEKCWS
jgi:hypothetical protein